MSDSTPKEGDETPAAAPTTAPQPVFIHPGALFSAPGQMPNAPWPAPTLLPSMLAVPPAEGADAGTPVQYVMLAPYGFPPIAGAPGMQPAYALGHEGMVMQRPKRKQVKRACQNCANACKKCDDERPCQRCQKYGIADTCEDQKRKERQKGIKRGPYKRKNKNSVPEPTMNVPPEGTEWGPPLMVPFPSGAEGPFLIPPGFFPPPIPALDPNAPPPPADANGAQPPPAFFPFTFPPLHHGYPQFVAGPPPAEEEKDTGTGSEKKKGSKKKGKQSDPPPPPINVRQDDGIAPSQLEGPGPENAGPSGI